MWYANRHQQALQFHRRLPEAIWDLLADWGVLEGLVHQRLLGWDGKRMTVPLFGPERRIAGFAYVDLSSPDRPLIESSIASKGLLYTCMPIEKAHEVVVVENVLDCLLLSSRGFRAVAPVGRTGLATPEAWRGLQGIRRVFVCFRRRDESMRAALLLQQQLTKAVRIVSLPAEVGTGGLFEYFIVVGRTTEDFATLLDTARSDG